MDRNIYQKSIIEIDVEIHIEIEMIIWQSTYHPQKSDIRKETR